VSSDTQFFVIQDGQVKLLDAAAFAMQILAKVPAATTNAPSAVTVTVGTPSQTAVPLTWTVPTSGTGTISYQVQYRPSGTSSWTNWGSAQTATSSTVAGLTAATSYDFRVIDSNAAGSSTSGTVTASTASAAPAAPTGLITSTPTSTTISLSWTASASGTPQITYQPQYRVTGTTPWTNFGGLISGTSVVVSGLAAGTSYDLQVVAQNAGGTTASTSITSSTTAAATVVSGQATGLAVTAGATTSTLPLSWTAPATGTPGFAYQVRYRVTGQTAWQNFNGEVVTTSETITGLSAATSYDVQVQSINSAGTSVSAILTTPTAAASASPGDGVTGTANTGTTAPVIAGPASGTITTSAVLDVTGITITDTFAASNGGTCSLNLNCQIGTLTATVGGIAVAGSGTSSIAYNNTFANCLVAVATLTYTASANAGADSIAVNLWNQQGSSSELDIPVTIHLPASSGGGGSGGTGGTGNPGDTTGTTAFRIADMMERFGVNTFSSLSATANVWGAYPSDFSAATVIAGINTILGSSGMTMNVREYHYAGRESIQSSWCPAVAGGTGAKFTMCIGQGGTDSDVASMVALAQSSSSGSSPWLSWLEGINEPNGVGFVSPAMTDTAQTDIWTNARTLPGVSIMGPSLVIGTPVPENYIGQWGAAATDFATLSANSSIVNVHFYPDTLPSLDDGSNRGGQINDVFIGEHNIYGNTDPEIITEWHPTYYNTTGSLQFNEAYNGYYSPITILEAFRAGFLGYYWFSLFDFSSTACGMFAQDTTVSPTKLTLRNGALAIQAMYQLGGPASATKHTFTPGKLNYTTSGLPAPINPASPNTGGQTMLFQNDAGQFLLYVWNAQVAPGGTAVPVMISFPSHAMTKVVEYNITNAGNNMTAVQTVTAASSITLRLAADVHLLVITY
jgi:hypothetical protein